MIIDMSDFTDDEDAIHEPIDTNEDLSRETPERLAYALKAAAAEYDGAEQRMQALYDACGVTFIVGEYDKPIIRARDRAKAEAWFAQAMAEAD